MSVLPIIKLSLLILDNKFPCHLSIKRWRLQMVFQVHVTFTSGLCGRKGAFASSFDSRWDVY